MNPLKKPIPVLMYHQINQSHPRSSLVISQESFSRQVNWLEKSGFHFLSVDEIIERGGKIFLWQRAVAFTFDDGFQDNYENALSLLVERGIPAAVFVVVNWVGQKGFLGWDEIRELADAGVTIGSHSLTHRWLPDLSDEEELKREIFDSKKRIEDEIRMEVRHFSYPVGGVNERVANWVRRAGYKAAWVAGARPFCKLNDPDLILRRVKVTPRDKNLSLFFIKAYGIQGCFR